MKLNFTGNWFIDLGILGFVNLIEEVYGWDLKHLNEKILLEENIVFYGLFPIAYLNSWLTVRGYKTLEKQTKYKEIKSKLENKSSQQIFDEVWWDYIFPMFKEAWKKITIKKLLEKQEIYKHWEKYLAVSEFVKSLNNLLTNYKNNSNFKNLLNRKKDINSLTIKDLNKIEDYVEKRKKDNIEKPFNDQFYKDLQNFYGNLQELKNSLLEHWEKLPRMKITKIDDKSRILFRLPLDHGFFKNFMFFNQSKNIWEQKELFYKLIKFDLNEPSLQKIDKTVNKLFPSDKEFPNAIYTQFSTKNFKNISDKLFVFLLCFPESFTRVERVSIIFYSNSLEFSYLVNKKLNITVKRRDTAIDSILNLTWRQIIDTLWEIKSSWALENMYLIQYKKLDNQSQQDVEYLGISKLQAELIIDDKVRDTLNTTIRILDKGNNPNRWLIEEFIKNRPLLPILYRNLGLYFGSKDSKNKREKKFKNTKALIYSAALNKVISELGVEKAILFSNDFFCRKTSTLEEVKDTIQRYFSLMFMTEELFSQESPDDIKSLAYRLFSRLRRSQKYPFVNELLKELNGKGSHSVEKLIKHSFENILTNDKTWQSEAIPILAGLIGGRINE